MSRTLMDHRPRRHRWPSLLISIIVKITAQCTSMLDAREWLPRLVSSGPICYPICPPIPTHTVLSHRIPVVHPSIHPSIEARSLCPRGTRLKWNKKHTPKCLGRRSRWHLASSWLVYCVGAEFGGMFKQRNELVDKHHYGYLASTLGRRNIQPSMFVALQGMPTTPLHSTPLCPLHLCGIISRRCPCLSLI